MGVAVGVGFVKKEKMRGVTGCGGGGWGGGRE